MSANIRALRMRSLSEAIDLNAPKGTAPWARAIRLELAMMWHDTTTNIQRFRDYLKLFDEVKGYQQLDDEFGHPFSTLRAFCVAHPPHGLGYDADVLDAIQEETRQITLGEKVAEIAALQAHGGDRRSEEFQPSNAKVEIRYGANTSYLTARLKRDHPTIAEDLAQGKYRSVRAAAKAAGIVHELSPLDYLHRYWRQVSTEDRLQFLVEMLTPNERRALSFGYTEED